MKKKAVESLPRKYELVDYNLTNTNFEKLRKTETETRNLKRRLERHINGHVSLVFTNLKVS